MTFTYKVTRHSYDIIYDPMLLVDWKNVRIKKTIDLACIVREIGKVTCMSHDLHVQGHASQLWYHLWSYVVGDWKNVRNKKNIDLACIVREIGKVTCMSRDLSVTSMYKVTRWTCAIFHHHVLFFDSENVRNKKNSFDLPCSVTEIGKVTYKWHDLTLPWIERSWVKVTMLHCIYFYSIIKDTQNSKKKRVSISKTLRDMNYFLCGGKKLPPCAINATFRGCALWVLTTNQPEYLADLIHYHQPQRQLRSASHRLLQCLTPRAVFGSRAFCFSAPRIWNSLPFDMTDNQLTLAAFKRSLKTFLFNRRFAGWSRGLSAPAILLYRLVLYGWHYGTIPAA